MRRSLIFLICVFVEITIISAQNPTFKCDGIYQTSDNGVKILNNTKDKLPITKTITDTTTVFNKTDGTTKKIIQVRDINIPDSYLIDTIPIVCFNDFKSVELKWQKWKKPILSIKLNDKAKQTFSNATSQNIGKPLIILFENKLISAPVVYSHIDSGNMDITGLDLDIIIKIIQKLDK